MGYQPCGCKILEMREVSAQQTESYVYFSSFAIRTIFSRIAFVELNPQLSALTRSKFLQIFQFNYLFLTSVAFGLPFFFNLLNHIRTTLDISASVALSLWFLTSVTHTVTSVLFSSLFLTLVLLYSILVEPWLISANKHCSARDLGTCHPIRHKDFLLWSFCQRPTDSGRDAAGGNAGSSAPI